MKLFQFKSSINSCSFLWLSDYVHLNELAVLLSLKDFRIIDSKVLFTLAYGYINVETKLFEEDPFLAFIEDINQKTNLTSIISSSISIYELHESVPEEVTVH